jgi:tubulin-specific chaperone C
MHDSRNVCVYLSCPSRPIIENSSGIQFAQYPAFVASKISMEIGKQDEWFMKELVEDFNWLRKEHSPNWRLLEKAVPEDIWRKALDIMEGSSVSSEPILNLVMGS